MRILITGAGGMLGRRLVETLGKGHEVKGLNRRELDITSLADVRGAIADFRPKWIVHAAAFTKVDEAETNPFEAFRVNALGSHNMAAASRQHGCAVLYFSTDYVFDGKAGRPLQEWDPTGPINEYGRSKLAGEWAVRSLNPDHLILRTSWLFGPNGSNFVDKIVEKAQSAGRLKVVEDQRGSPTFTRDLAQAAMSLLERQSRGTYHVTNSGDCSWYELAAAIVQLRGVKVDLLPVPSTEFPAPARRPCNSVLDNSMLKLEGQSLLRHWRDALEDYLEAAHG